MKTPTTYEINGFAVREFRMQKGIAVAALANEIGVTRAYVTKIELGHSLRVSPKTLNALLTALSIRDRRSLLANPHAVSAEDEVA